VNRLFFLSVASVLFLGAPAHAQEQCPVELTEAAADLDEARSAHQDARTALFDDNWKARLSMANDRDAEMALHAEAKADVKRLRQDRREARRTLRAVRSDVGGSASCLSSSSSASMWTRLVASIRRT